MTVDSVAGTGCMLDLMRKQRQDSIMSSTLKSTLKSAGKALLVSGTIAAFAALTPAQAHGPLFSPGPETIFNEGTEITLGYKMGRASGAGTVAKTYEPFFEFEYGLTQDWQIGLEIPYAWRSANGFKSNGPGDVSIATKYQLWKRDLPGAQYKAAGFLKVKFPTGKSTTAPPLGSGSVDVTTGLATGYESRRWYWFASAAYQANTKGSGGLNRGDMQFLNAVGGIRPVLTEYNEADTVVMVELNWERAGRDKLNGAAQANTGGWQMFVSPLVWWTKGQIALKGGVQIPIASNLKGAQASTDYRAKVEFVYHF